MTSSSCSPPGKLTLLNYESEEFGSFLILYPGEYKHHHNLKHCGPPERKAKCLWKYDQQESRNGKLSLVTSM